MTDASYRWVIVAAGGLLGCMAVGALFSLPVLLVPISQDTGWSNTGVSATMTIGFISSALAAMGWGMLSDRLGPRPVVLIGSTILVVGLALASRATSLLQFQLLFGLLIGGASAAIFAPMMASVTGWFDTNRSLAVSLVSAGIGIAPMTISPLAAWLVSIYDWRTTLTIVAALAAIVMLPMALLVRRPPALESGGNEASAPDVSDAAMPLSQTLKSPQFVILLATFFACCATHSGPIFHTVSNAVHHGIPMMAAVTIYSVEGLAGLFGRVGFGILGDRLGAKRVLVAGLLAQAFGALAYAFVTDLGAFYVVAAIFGFIYSGIMPLYAVLARENFPLRMMGTVIGGMSMTSSLGMASGPLVGGLIFDTFASYTWLFVGSWAIGVGAFLISMMFQPRTEEQPEPAPAREYSATHV
jgi:MFS family permease